MHENELAKIVVDAAFQIHLRLGPGLLESVYQTILCYELRKLGLGVEKEVPIPLRWENVAFEEGFRADLIVESKLLVELKSIEQVSKVHKKIVLTYLRLTDFRLGLLINFGKERIKEGISRIVNGLLEEASHNVA